MLSFTGCFSTSQDIYTQDFETWDLPPKPILEKVNFVPTEDGNFIVASSDAEKLANNIDELKAYIEKMELLIDKMKDYYKETN